MLQINSVPMEHLRAVLASAVTTTEEYLAYSHGIRLTTDAAVVPQRGVRSPHRAKARCR